MFQNFFTQFQLVLNFISSKVLTIQIANLSLLSWIIVLVLVAGIVKLLFSLRPTARIKNKTNNKNERSEE